MIALAAKWGNADTPASPQQASAATNQQQKPAVRVITANIRYSDPKDTSNLWTDRRDFLLDTVLKQSPDIVGYQEVTPAQGAFLTQKMPGYGFAPRDDGKKSLIGTLADVISSMNLLMWRADRFEEVSSKNGSLGATSGVDSNELTFYTQAVLRDKSHQLPDLIVINCHIRHGVKQALASVGDLQNLIAQWRREYPSAEVVIMGDMNHDRNSKVYAAMTQPDNPAAAIIDSFNYALKKKGERWGNYHNFTGRPSAEWPTDLIFHSSGLANTPAVILRNVSSTGKYPSDHFFVMTEISK